ncbi:MAG: aminoglycoside phosphotransferase family protein [Actinomycetota bacterium]
MIDEVRAFLAARPDLLPSETDLDGAIVAGIDRESSAKVTCLFFDHDGNPTVAAKIARREPADRSLAQEHAVLSQLWRLDTRAIRSCVPRPIALERIRGRLAMITSALPGGPMSARYYTPGHVADRAAVAEDFHAASAWLRRLEEDTRSGATRLDAMSLEAWTRPVFDRYRQEIGWGDPEERLLAMILERGSDLFGTALPITAVHGDYWMGNLLLSGGAITGVVDWELGRTAGLPFADIYKFPTSYAFYLDRSGRSLRGEVPGHPERAAFEQRWRRYGTWPNLAGFAYGYFGRGWFPEQVRRFVLGHLAWLGLPAQLNGIFFPLFLAQQATSLDVPSFREGYRSVVRALVEERDSTWLWQDTTIVESTR